MKTPLIIIMLTLFSAGTFAESIGNGWVVANGVTYFCRAIKTGLVKTRIMTTDGDVVKVPNYSIQAYLLNGRQYELLPLVNLRGDTIDLAFMEFITMRNGSRLYRYCSNCSKYDPLYGEIAPLNRVYRYYVLREGRMKLLTDEETDMNLAFFNIRVLSDIRR